jgi:UDP-N-acetylmuramate--alanine ligase
VAALRQLGADIWIGADAARMNHPDLVVTSTGVARTSPGARVEVAAAEALGIPVIHRARALALLMDGQLGVAVAGNAGKTTTTGMIVSILRAAGLDPSYAVGGDFLDGGANAGAGGGPHFVVEADESDGSFLELRPQVAVVTNVQADHLDYYADLEAVRAAFRQFVALLPADGTLVLCADDPGALALAQDAPCPVVTYGLGEGAAVRAAGLVEAADGSRFAVQAGGQALGEVTLRVPGSHNAQNALGAIAVAGALGVPFERARRALASYAGMARRFHLRGQRGGVTVVDDYAHHPTKLAATLATAKLGDWRRVVAVFQPHRYSRTKALAAELGRSLIGADLLIVTDVYPGANEDPDPTVDGTRVAAAARAARPDLELIYVPRRAELAKQVAAVARPGDLVLTLGAGDITHLADELLPLLPETDHEHAAEGDEGGDR